MATVTSLGIGAGMDLQGLLENLMNVERQPLNRLKSQTSSYNSTISALGTLSSKLSSLRTAAQNLKPATLQTPLEKFATYTGTLEDDKVGKVTVGDGAVAGKYNLEVLSLAKGQKTVTSGSITAGALSFTFAGGDAGRDFSVDVASGASMADVAKAINASAGAKNAGISATVVGDSMIISGETGADNAFTLGGGVFDTPNVINTQEASDAAIKIDNAVTVTSQTNKFADALSGVTIDLSSTAAGTSTTLTVTKNIEDKLRSSLEAFVKAFNDAATSMSSLGAYNSETGVAGALQGNNILRDSQSMLSNLVFNTKLDDGTQFGAASLSSIGIAFSKNSDGTLTIDADKLKAAIAADPEKVAKLAEEVGKQFDAALDKVVGTGGRIDSSTDSIKSTIRMLDKQYEAMERRLDSVEERYRAQFTALDTLIAKLGSTSNWLAQSLSSLQTSYVSS
ncbi:MAG: flagellar filament capping protein FliD [Zoogloeaceae bacterium]|jgi:flagellar hook-associated protein 2|nr:flagellar filament capping protein FliD [Zoogloeaceae bacterium]